MFKVHNGKLETKCKEILQCSINFTALVNDPILLNDCHGVGRWIVERAAFARWSMSSLQNNVKHPITGTFMNAAEVQESLSMQVSPCLKQCFEIINSFERETPTLMLYTMPLHLLANVRRWHDDDCVPVCDLRKLLESESMYILTNPDFRFPSPISRFIKYCPFDNIEESLNVILILDNVSEFTAPSNILRRTSSYLNGLLQRCASSYEILATINHEYLELTTDMIRDLIVALDKKTDVPHQNYGAALRILISSRVEHPQHAELLSHILKLLPDTPFNSCYKDHGALRMCSATMDVEPQTREICKRFLIEDGFPVIPDIESQE